MAFDVPLGQLAFDDPGFGAQSPFGVAPVCEPADGVLPKPLAGLGGPSIGSARF